MFVPLNRIFLILGTKCNLQCKYCLQHDMVDHANVEVSSKVITWIKKQARMSSRKITLTFYGGEPLVYWETIRQVVVQLEGVVRFSVITNGKLLDAEKVNFLNDYNFGVAVSWDGKNVLKTRGYDVSFNRHILDVNNLSISGVMSKYNYPKDFLDAVKHLSDEYETLHGYPVNVNIDTIMDFGNCGELRNMDLNKIRTQMKQLLMSADPLHQRFIQNLHRMEDNNRRYGKNLSAGCGNGISVWNIDPLGNVYKCHNCGEYLGTLYEPTINILKKAMLADPTHENYETRCKDCEIQAFCNNGCPLVDSKGREEYYCDLKRAYFGELASESRNIIYGHSVK